MPAEKKSIWEKITILTSFIAAVTALIVTIAGLVTVQVESGKRDVVIADLPDQSITSDPIQDVPVTTQTTSAQGWAYIGQTKYNKELAQDDTFIFEQNTNIRSDYPRFPLYQFAPIIKVVPKNTEVTVLDLRENVGIRNFTWIYVNATWEVERN